MGDWYHDKIYSDPLALYIWLYEGIYQLCNPIQKLLLSGLVGMRHFFRRRQTAQARFRPVYKIECLSPGNNVLSFRHVSLMIFVLQIRDHKQNTLF